MAKNFKKNVRKLQGSILEIEPCFMLNILLAKQLMVHHYSKF